MYNRLKISFLHVTGNTGYAWLLVLIAASWISCETRSCPDAVMLENRKWTGLRSMGSMEIPQKLWHHRTNQPDKFKQLAGSYTGFELDVNINSQGRFLEVYHHPEKPSGIDFRQYLEMKESAGKYFWLDCKNLNPENADLAIVMLNELDSIYRIKNRIIFESASQRTLQRIREAGYHSVFYLALPELKNNCSDTAYLQRISENWDQGLLGVSAEAQYIPLLNRYLPAVKKMTWCNNPVNNLLFNEKNKMLTDSSVLIVLEQQ